MALKTIFKGTINGKEFDNVKDYNAEMTRLINANETVDAKSETRMVEVCETCNCEQCTCDKQPMESTEEVNMLPFFDTPAAYLDKLVSTDSNTNKRALADLEEFLQNHVHKISKRTAKFDVDQLNGYAKNIKNVLKQLKYDEKKTEECLDKIEEKIAELESKYNCLEASLDAIGILWDFYDEVLSKTTYRINNSIHNMNTNEEEKMEYRDCKCQESSCASGNEKLNEELRNHYKSNMKDFWDDLLKILY